MKFRHAELGSASIPPKRPKVETEKWTLKQVQGDGLAVGNPLKTNAFSAWGRWGISGQRPSEPTDWPDKM